MKLRLFDHASPFVMSADDGGEGGGGGGADPAAPPTTEKPWYDGADAALVGHIQTKGWHDKPAGEAALAAIRAHQEAEKFIGAPADRLVKLPTDPNDAEGWKAVWTKLGAPAEAKDYDFTGLKFADDKPVEPAFVDWLRAKSHELNLPKDAATRLGTEFVKYLDASSTTAATEKQAALVEEHTKLDKEWGPNKEANLFVAKQGAAKLGLTPEQVTALEGVVGYAGIMEALRKVGDLAGEGRFISSAAGPGNGIMTREQAVARKDELMRDEGWTKRYLEGGVSENKELTALITLITAE